jgi:hypothetical protein
MNFALMSQLITIMLCVGVIVQATRMMRELKTVANGDMAAVVSGLDRATTQASMVLAELKRTLGGDGAAMAETLSQGREIQEELTMLIGIANSMAERLVEAGQARNSVPAPVEPLGMDEPRVTGFRGSEPRGVEPLGMEAEQAWEQEARSAVEAYLREVA